MNTSQAKTSITPRELQRLIWRRAAPPDCWMSAPRASSPTAHVPGAGNYPLDDLDPAAFQQERGAGEPPVYVLCQSGGRARKAIEQARTGREFTAACWSKEARRAGWTRGCRSIAARAEFAADAPGANHRRPYFGRWRGSRPCRQPALCHHPAVSLAAVLCLPGSRALAAWRCCWQKCRGIAPKAAAACCATKSGV